MKKFFVINACIFHFLIFFVVVFLQKRRKIPLSTPYIKKSSIIIIIIIFLHLIHALEMNFIRYMHSYVCVSIARLKIQRGEGEVKKLIKNFFIVIFNDFSSRSPFFLIESTELVNFVTQSTAFDLIFVILLQIFVQQTLCSTNEEPSSLIYRNTIRTTRNKNYAVFYAKSTR